MDVPSPNSLPGNSLPPGSQRYESNEDSSSGTSQQTAATHQLDQVSTEDVAETISRVVQDLFNKHLSLSRYIDQHAEEMSLPEYSHLLALHAQMASRLGRLLRDRIVISPEIYISDPLQEAMDAAYLELSDILGTNLTADPDYVPKTVKQT